MSHVLLDPKMATPLYDPLRLINWLIAIIFVNNNCEIGVFSKLTNAYCLVSSTTSSTNFFTGFESKLKGVIPIVMTSIGESGTIGSLYVGNKNGLLLSHTITDQELQHVRDSLPDQVVVQRIEEPLCALGNAIACNDYVALVHPKLEKETEEIISDFTDKTIANNELVGSYCALSNIGGMVHPDTKVEEMKELANLLQVPLVAGTVNRGSQVISADTTAIELSVVNSIFKLAEAQPNFVVGEMRKPLIDTYSVLRFDMSNDVDGKFLDEGSDKTSDSSHIGY
ncbi:unnamed protein product [Thlaspi arvense]|uniref:Eukaryotic translation initiation factor 6 n=1 Tax=Thlaspi arvense TaxID=13288 RepID=A0AAU9S9Y9_THLAR|nr:unnamed protein product [Thlaspi arvense]